MTTLPTLPIPQLTHIPGLRFRCFNGEPNYPTLVAIQEARAEADQIDPRSSYECIPTLTSIAADYRAAEPFAPRDTTLVVEINGIGIAYTTIEWWEEQDGTWVYLHESFVVPQWRNQGIEQALLKWNEDRLFQLATLHQTQDKAVLAANATSAEPERQTLLLDAGYQEVFAMLEMELPTLEHLPLPSPRDDVRITQAQPTDYRLIWEAMHEAYQGRTMFKVLSEDEYGDFLNDLSHDPTLELVAWDGPRVAGMVFVRVNQDHGVVDECNVHPAYRRRGLATTLLIYGLGLLRERGVASVRLHVRKHNETGAQQVYERLGFQVRKEFLRFRKRLTT